MLLLNGESLDIILILHKLLIITSFYIYIGFIIILQKNHICQFIVNIVPIENQKNQTNGVDEIFNSSTRNINIAPSMCEKDVLHDDVDVIEFMIFRKSVYNSIGVVNINLIGSHFNAYVRYTPATYDHNQVIIKTELMKLYRKVQVNKDEDGDDDDYYNDGNANLKSSTSSLNIPKNKIIRNVHTFVTLPNGELIVFFEKKFCYIDYLNFQVSRLR